MIFSCEPIGFHCQFHGSNMAIASSKTITISASCSHELTVMCFYSGATYIGVYFSIDFMFLFRVAFRDTPLLLGFD